MAVKSGKLPLLITFCPYGVVDPKLGSWELLNQVLRFFWKGLYMFIGAGILLEDDLFG